MLTNRIVRWQQYRWYETFCRAKLTVMRASSIADEVINLD